MPRLWQLRLVPVLAVAFAFAGCSYRLDAIGSKSVEPELVTGSIKTRPAASLPPERDLTYAREAARAVVARQETSASAPWENPHTGARGSVTALAAAYPQGGTQCRDFLASYVDKSSESWMQGEACQVRPGNWEVRSLRPWTKT